MRREDLRLPCVHGRYEPHMTRELPTVSNESMCSVGHIPTDAELAELIESMGYVRVHPKVFEEVAEALGYVKTSDLMKHDRHDGLWVQRPFPEPIGLGQAFYFTEATEEDHRLVLDTARAVLDARQIWWCGRLGPLMKGRCDHHSTSGLGCGPVKVVPVKGGQE